MVGSLTELEDGAGLCGVEVVLSVSTYIVSGGADMGVDLSEELGRRLSTDIGGSGDKGTIERGTEVVRKRFTGDTDGYGAVLRFEEIGKVGYLGVDDSGRFYLMVGRMVRLNCRLVFLIG